MEYAYNPFDLLEDYFKAKRGVVAPRFHVC